MDGRARSVASLIASAPSTVPIDAALHPQPGRAPAQHPRRSPPAAEQDRRLPISATAICSSPSSNPCSTRWPAAGCSNCGISDRYSTATFGLSRFVISPIANSRRGESGAIGRAGSKTDTPPGRSVLNASQQQVAAPAILTAR